MLFVHLKTVAAFFSTSTINNDHTQQHLHNNNSTIILQPHTTTSPQTTQWHHVCSSQIVDAVERQLRHFVTSKIVAADFSAASTLPPLRRSVCKD
jgi:hypothetical protein